MRTTLWTIAAGLGASLALPVQAFAATADVVTPPVRLGAELVGLLVALVLLLQARKIRVEMAGSAFAEKMTFVVLATLCLAASAFVAWLQNFVVTSVYSLVGFASQLLVIAAMALLAVYFYRVRTTLNTFLGKMTGAEQLEGELYAPSDSEASNGSRADAAQPEGAASDAASSHASAVGE